MANSLYAKGREGFLDGSIDWDTHVIKCVAVDSGYTPNFSTDDNLDDIPGAARVSTSPALTGKTVVGGVADADDVTFAGVPASKTINRLVLYKDTGVESTSRLIGALDTLASGLAIAIPTGGGGGSILFRWSNGTNRIFKL